MLESHRVIFIDAQHLLIDVSVSIGSIKNLTEENGRLVGVMEYSADLYDEKTVRRLLEHYRKLLEGVVAKPEESVSRLPQRASG